ncbi:MAG: hypothetical protein ABIH59_02000 [archaeon]
MKIAIYRKGMTINTPLVTRKGQNLEGEVIVNISSDAQLIAIGGASYPISDLNQDTKITISRRDKVPELVVNYMGEKK